VLDDLDYSRELAMAGGWRAVLAVPLLHEGRSVGAVTVAKAEPKPFSERQIELLKTFADQALIAIDNVQLFEAERLRTRELRESLQQQTATADVLKVISRSAFDLQTVFDTLIESAAKLCEADFAWMFRRVGDLFYWAAGFGQSSEEYARIREYFKDREVRPDRSSITGRCAIERKVIHVSDVLADPEYTWRGAQALGGYRAALGAPLLRDGNVVGVIFLSKKVAQPFTQNQIDLVTTFADQAVIAIENVRLFDEVQASTRELSESLEQQTATSEILEVISNSPTDTQPAFDAIVHSGLNLFSDSVVAISLPDRDLIKLAAIAGTDKGGVEALRGRYPMPLSHEFITGTAILDRREIDLADAQEPPKELIAGARNLLAGGYRAMTVMPMMRGDQTIGTLNVVRRRPGQLSEKQRELLRTFAKQAVIAIENTRLFNEVRESLQQQTATADVLKVISRSTFDLQTVLNTLTESAALLCAADRSVIFQRDGDLYRLGANYGFSRDAEQYAVGHPLRPGRGSIIGRVASESRAIHIPDVMADSEYTLTDYQRTFGYRTALGVPLLREGETIGTLTLTRDLVNPFTDKQIELATTFADQAVIAIENVRLFDEVQARTRELSESLEDLRATQDRLVQTQKLASLGQLTAGIAHEIKNPLNFVNNFSGVSSELIDELQDMLKACSLDDKARADMIELTDTLRSNLDKIVQHGKRADAIVKNMLLHSREGSVEHRVVDVNSIVEDSLNLAYHGARAENQDFNITLKRSLDPMAGEADLFPQDITRALLNFISNGFYAATKRHSETNGRHEPTLAATTKNLGDRVAITIRDNGTGIPPEVKEKMFNPFFTTKPAGEGTGLGLSISHDIIVKQHGGSIDVNTQPGEFTEISVILPRIAAFV
jgi:GAF domain-containing protein